MSHGTLEYDISGVNTEAVSGGQFCAYTAVWYHRVDSGGEFPGLKTTVFDHFWAVLGA